MRKTDNDIKEIVSQVQKILETEYIQAIVAMVYGVELQMTTKSAFEVSTNLCVNDPRGTSQLVAIGLGGSITGKHFDIVFTDDIVNIKDRMSKAERDRTKVIYQELQNVKNRGGRIFNTGTPWHSDDCFTIMPKAKVFDCYSTGLIDDESLKAIKDSMTASLFAANYEMRHIASDDVIFSNPNIGYDNSLVEQGICHIDAAYGGEDFTAFTILKKSEGKYYVFGKLWRKHVDDCLDECTNYRVMMNAGKVYCENNGDKGYLAKDLKKRGERVVVYHENMNKFVKITSYLKVAWKDVYFVEGTDQEYINQICDYNENAEHDDAPDSLASIIMRVFFKKESNQDNVNSMFM